ncbi:hypothetical protein PN836_004915 [Ningiella sp. W23]|uniref:phosphatase domain-containing putative toxin n=1 Tax=Ningiella sp. W23 TaxID=3023715 RepID=UPI003757C590
MPRRLPADNPSFVKQLLASLPNDFGITPYQDKMGYRILPKFMVKKRKPLRNFQWVQTRGLRIARCAQPNYNRSVGKDENHTISHEQLQYIMRNGIKTVISLNRAILAPISKAHLNVNHIEYFHFPKQDYTALDLNDHQMIDNIIQRRKDCGAFLFYCGYGQGRTGTAIAGLATKYLVCHQQDYFSRMHFKQYIDFVSSAFGVETNAQVLELIKYAKSLATVQVGASYRPPTPLLNALNSNFVNADDYQDNASLASARPASIRSLPSSADSSVSGLSAPPLPTLPVGAVLMQSLDSVGMLRNGPQAHLITQPRNSLSSLLSYEYQEMHPDSFYFHNLAIT